MSISFTHNRLYWYCQCGGWLFFYLTSFSFATYTNGFLWYIVLGHLITTATGFFLTHQYRNLLKGRNWNSIGIKDIAIRIILASFVIGAIWTAIVIPTNELLKFIFPVDMLPNRHAAIPYGAIVIFSFLNLTLIIFIWSLIYFTYKYFTNYKESEIDKWRLEAAVKDAQLLALKSQINPHFMFNCLNNIRSLVVENPEKARDMILHLSDLLRYSLQYSNKERINLEDELEIVKNYLTLESIQYEDRLRYKLEISEETLEMKIPPMAVQLLVENAIKHGISLLPEGGEIKIHSRLDKDNLIVEVVNSGQLLEKNKPVTGIGLRNAADRLQLLFGQLATLTVKNKDSNHVLASFTVPKLY